MKSMNIAEWDEFYPFQFSSLAMIGCGAGRKEMEGVCGAEDGVILDSSSNLWCFTITTLVTRFSGPRVQKNLIVFHVSSTGLSKPRRSLDCLLSLVYPPKDGPKDSYWAPF